MTHPIHERARAKINLMLRVAGRRADGYHEIDSLVAFADAVADRVTLLPGAVTGIRVTGPFGGGIAGENLISTTLRLLAEAEPRLVLGQVTLEKNLPVASGIGGGSADAAAVMRAVQRANPALTGMVDWSAIAARLGADVPVCLLDRAAWMSGIGDVVAPLERALPRLDAVLVNPLAPVPADKTAQVFRRLGAPPLKDTGGASTMARPAIPDRAELVALMQRCGNDLEAPAQMAVGEIAAVLVALEALPGAEIVQLSGAGPTCFAVFGDHALAEARAGMLREAHPEWWVAATTLS